MAAEVVSRGVLGGVSQLQSVLAQKHGAFGRSLRASTALLLAILAAAVVPNRSAMASEMVVQNAGEASPAVIPLRWDIATDRLDDASRIGAASVSGERPITLAMTALGDGASTPLPDNYGPLAPAVPTAAPERHRSFGSQVGAVKWEIAGLAAYMTAGNIIKLSKVGAKPFSFQNEGWFGKDTNSLGVDKFTHAFNTYVLTDLIHWRIRRKAGDAAGTALTAAVLASGLMAYNEIFDGVKKTSGWSHQDVIANTAGAAFSMLRSSVPGMKEKVDFRLLVMPNHEIYTFMGKEHFAQQRYLFALKLSGFSQLERSPLRLVELHAGYYAVGFTRRDRERGRQLDQRPFVGIGLNLRELFFRNPKSTAARIGDTALEYLQVPYTAAHFH